MIYCSKCRTKINKSLKFCPSCGRKIAPPNLVKFLLFAIILTTVISAAIFSFKKFFLAKKQTSQEEMLFDKEAFFSTDSLAMEKANVDNLCPAILYKLEKELLEEASAEAKKLSRNPQLIQFYFSVNNCLRKDQWPYRSFEFYSSTNEATYKITWQTPFKKSVEEEKFKGKAKAVLSDLVFPPKLSAKYAVQMAFSTFKKLWPEKTILSVSGLIQSYETWHITIHPQGEKSLNYFNFDITPSGATYVPHVKYSPQPLGKPQN